jgi:hypothetical protein
MIQCMQCHQHLFPIEVTCPHCGAVVHHGTDNAIRPSTAALLLGLMLGGCDDGDEGTELMYGVPMTDNDGDGWAMEDGDCDDSDESINPGAEETPGDGVDSNCDGFDDT